MALAHETSDQTSAGKSEACSFEKPASSLVLTFALAFLLAPTFILLHECGHYVVHYLQGHRPVLYSSEVDIRKAPASGRVGQLLSLLGGPMVEASLCIGGFIWLKRRRERFFDTEPTTLDWLATLMALCCGRWIHHTPKVLWSLLRLGWNRSDEEGISTLLGLPPWVVPVTLFLPACWMFVAIIQLHPRPRRLLPFGTLFLGGVLGGVLWMSFVGPALLGTQPHPFHWWSRVPIPPHVVSMLPANASTEVSPGLTEIRITFDRPMITNSWAWCGSGPHFPEGMGKPHYDATHTVWSVPVKLKPDWVYEFSLNSDPRYAGFMSEEYVCLAPVSVRFRTKNMGN